MNIKKRTLLLLIAGILIGGFFGLAANYPTSEEVDPSESDYYQPEITHEEVVIDTAETAVKAVVAIERDGESGGGSGFFITSDGYILTNRHVLTDEDSGYTVTTHDGISYEAEVVSRDLNLDIAFLHIEGEDFDTLPLGDSEELRLGQTAMAIGYSLGELRNSVSVGVVSGLVRDIYAREGFRVERLEGMIQTDAAINLGNSGGPLLNLKGEVIGINTATDVFADNIGFAIPVNQVKRSVDSVIEHGRIMVPFLGIRYMMITDSELVEGAIISSEDPRIPPVEEGSPAEEAGFQEGDIITAFDDNPINMENPLWEVIMEYMPGDTVEIEFYRDDELMTVEVELAERPSD